MLTSEADWYNLLLILEIGATKRFRLAYMRCKCEEQRYNDLAVA
jgi:hypothetical protein